MKNRYSIIPLIVIIISLWLLFSSLAAYPNIFNNSNASNTSNIAGNNNHTSNNTSRGGSNTGGGSGTGNSTGSGSGTGNSTGSGTGTSNSTGSGSGTGNSTGSGTGTGNSTGSGTGTGNSTGSGSGTSNSTGSGTGTGNSTGSGTGTGNSTGSGTGTGNSTGSGTGTGNSTGSGTGTGNSTGSGTGTGNSTGSGTGTGNSSSGSKSNTGNKSSSTNTTTNIGPSPSGGNKNIFLSKYSLLLEIIIIAIISTLVGVVTYTTIKNRKNMSIEKSNMDNSENKKISSSKTTSLLVLEEGEQISKFKGWYDENSLIYPEIDHDLPLIWEIDKNLPIKIKDNSTLKTADNIEFIGDQSFNVKITSKCCKLEASLDGYKEIKRIRGTKYEDEVVKLMKLNFIKDQSEDFSVKTIREIIKKEYQSLDNISENKISEIIKIYEKALYGKKKIDRKEFEIFLRDLRDCIKEPWIIVCGVKSGSENKQ